MLDIRFTIPALAFAVPVAALVVAGVVVGDRRHGRSWRHTVVRGAFALYLIAVVTVTQFPLQVVIGEYAAEITVLGAIQWVPILTIDTTTFLLNIVMFLPFGVLLPLATRVNSARAVAAVSALASLSIELVQLTTQVLLNSGRASDVYDLIANTIGAVLGFGALTIAARSRRVLSVLPHGSPFVAMRSTPRAATTVSSPL